MGTNVLHLPSKYPDSQFILFPFLASSFLLVLISLWLQNSLFPILDTSLILQPASQSSTAAAKVSLSCILLFGQNVNNFITDLFPPRKLFFGFFLFLLNFFWQKYRWLGQVYSWRIMFSGIWHHAVWYELNISGTSTFRAQEWRLQIPCKCQWSLADYTAWHYRSEFDL